jgi:hypothetical protein
MLVLVPSGGAETRQGRRLLVNGVTVDYNATLLPNNLIRNPDVDTALTNDAGHPSFWHYSAGAAWSASTALSPTHSLELVDNSPTAAEEWRSYSTSLDAGTNRTLDLRWFWKYAIAAGAEFRARLRLSNDLVTSVDLTNPVAEYNFTISGLTVDFQMFESMIALPDGVRSFDLTFISGGALGATGTIHIDDISAAIVTALALLGDYNHNGVVDAADYIVWRKSFGSIGSGLAADGNGDNAVNLLDYDIWRVHFGDSAGAAATAESQPIPEPSTAILSLLGCVVALMIRRRGERC